MSRAVARGKLPGTALRAVLLAALAALASAASAHAQAPSYPDAVVLVSGYDSSTPFTTPDPDCDGMEGGTWDNSSGPAAALKAAGLAVFTAPVMRGTETIPAPCPSSGAPLPGNSTYIDSFGDDEANGAALASLLAFLRDNYGVERVQFVAHSDGGNWSRSAITQNGAYSGVAVRSLTTLGTPYTGSMLADIGVELNNGSCDFANRIEQELCEALLDIVDVIFKDGGQTAIHQLTHTYLESWNPEQSIGACPVTTIAGTGVDLPLIPFSYYNPSDGLVGEASALSHSALEIPSFETIPAPAISNLQSGGTFPVVHTPSLSFINPANLLNTPAISSKVTEIVTGTPPGPQCNVMATVAPAAATAPGRGASRAAEQRIRLPLRLYELPSLRGFFRRPGPEDVVLTKRNTRVRCGRSRVPLVPLLADKRLWIGFPRECESRLRVPGSPKPDALLIRSHPKNDIVVTVTGTRLQVSIRGPEASRVRVRVRTAEGSQPLQLDAQGGARLPAGNGSATVVVRTVDKQGRLATAAGVIGL